MDSTTVKGISIVTVISYLFYTSILTFIIFLVLIVIHYTVKPFLSFLPSSDIKETTVEQNFIGTTLFDTSVAPPDTKMTFNPPITELRKDNFTLTFDCYLNSAYRSTTVPRVLLYYGSTPVTITDNNSLREFNSTSEEVPKLFTVDNSDLLTKFQHSNFIIYIDPVKNDLKVGVFTVDKIDSTKKYLEIASIIPNIPVNQSFQISMVLGRTFVEVYKNKKLVNTYKIGNLAPSKVILNTSAVPSSEHGIFTPVSFIGDNVKIGNVQLYNGPLTSGQIRDLTPTLKTAIFFR
jgi:hypothetical protein